MDKAHLIHPLSASDSNDLLNYYKEYFLGTLKNENGALRETISNLAHTQHTVDPKCVIKINKKLVRIEYPGEVVNVDRAIHTLGGIENIEASVSEHRNKLQLHFHPLNRFSKPCTADKEFKPGIVIKVVNGDNHEIDYHVIGVSVMNFTFTRLCDFEFLPLIAKDAENPSSKTDYIYDEIMPDSLPDLEWLTKEESKKMTSFLIPVRFSHYDSSQMKFVDKGEPESLFSKSVIRKQKKACRIFGKNKQQISIFVNFKDKEIPTMPLAATLKLAKNKAVEDQIARVTQLFKERPIWTKAAVQYNTGLTIEQSKIVLPMVAYYIMNGPWRISWVKYGYDPRKDPKARIYQTLDYRIRTAESARLKVNSKRNSKWSLYVGPRNVKKVSLNDNISAKPKQELDERCYVLRPNTFPPARQMFYQFCDIIIPEIQDMISRLPRTPEKVCDSKNGWLPKNFIEKCREIVNNYVLQAVQTELLKDKEIMDEKVLKQKAQRLQKKSTMDYCNQMLSNIKKGIYKNVNIKLTGPSKDVDDISGDTELISLSSDDEDGLTVGEIIDNALPENLNQEEDDEDSDAPSQSSDEPEIDIEAVQEINQMISELNKI